MKAKILINLIVVLAAFSFLGLPAASAATADKTELKQRAEKRYPQLRQLKADGMIGETDEGYVEVVEGKKAPADAAKLVDEENADRRELYQILAKEGNTTPDQVAHHAAMRNFDRARAGEWLKENGKWHQKT